MRVLFDIVHPAHVHFFKHMIRALQGRGHEVRVIARDKDVACMLLDRERIAYTSVGSPQVGRFRQLRELVSRDRFLIQEIRRNKIDVVATRNPTGVQAARLAGATGIFDTDDGSEVGLHFHLARPFAHVLTSPDCLTEDWGRKHVKYRGYKQLAYLHPDHFTPDPSVLTEVGLAKDEPFFIVRFVAMTASHDHTEQGLRRETKLELLRRLEARGRVLLSMEGKVPDEWAHLAYKGSPHRMHDLIAFAQLVIGDSQTMAAEAAVLGTPSLRASSFARRLGYLRELEQRYQLTFDYAPDEHDTFLRKLDEILEAGREISVDGRRRMLSEKINIADWYVDFLERTGS